MELKILKTLKALLVVMIILIIVGLWLDIVQDVKQNQRDSEVQFHY